MMIPGKDMLRDNVRWFEFEGGVFFKDLGALQLYFEERPELEDLLVCNAKESSDAVFHRGGDIALITREHVFGGH